MIFEARRGPGRFVPQPQAKLKPRPNAIPESIHGGTPTCRRPESFTDRSIVYCTYRRMMLRESFMVQAFYRGKTLSILFLHHVHCMVNFIVTDYESYSMLQGSTTVIPFAERIFFITIVYIGFPDRFATDRKTRDDDRSLSCGSGDPEPSRY